MMMTMKHNVTCDRSKWRWSRWIVAVAGCIGALLPQAVAAQVSDSIVVSLVTFYPGDQLHSLYGHTELRVRNAAPHGMDAYFNYGVFDFRAPNFVGRFVLGETDYLCVGIPAQYATQGMEGRKMIEQDLNLTQEQARGVAAYMLENIRPENATYRYRYLSDNCATRPRDIIERALGDSLLYHTPAAQQPPATFRSMARYYNRNYAWYRLGIDFLLGAPADTALDWRAQMFVPMVLMDALDSASVLTASGRAPLVTRRTVMVPGSDDGLAGPPTPWYLHPVTAALLLLALVIAIDVRDWRRHRMTRWLDCALYGVLGLIGCLLTFMVTCSTHESLSPNYVLLWAHPLCLVPAVAVWCRRNHGWLKRYHWLNLVELIVVGLLWAWIPQCGNATFALLAAASAVRSLGWIVTKIDNPSSQRPAVRKK